MRSKKFIFAIGFLVLLVVSQSPFVYRRYELRRLSANLQQLNFARHPTEGFSEYKGVLHVHSFLGGHSTGTFSEIIAAAQANQLNFVIMTEHTERDFDTAAMTLRGVHGDVLFINGNEVSAPNGDRTLSLPDNVSLVAYPEQFQDWETPGLNGVEIYNVYTNAKRISPIVAFFDVLWSQRSYPDLIFALYLARPNEALRKWDQELRRTRLTGVAGNDAHANIGVSLKDSSGKTLLGVQLDPYEISFRLVRVHVLLDQNITLEAKSLSDAIRAGHCFIGFDFLGDTSGFEFSAVNAGTRWIQGDEIQLASETRLIVRSPTPGRIVLFKDGMVFSDDSGISSKDVTITERGVYRAEVYLPQLGSLVAHQPWIISNPIYVR